MQYAYIGLKQALSVTPTVEGDYYLADIPDVLLFQNKELQCYVYVEENDSGVTVYEIDMTIMPRAKPADGQYTPQQIDNYDALIGQVNQLIEQTQELRDGLDEITDDAIAATEEITNTTFEVNQEDGCLYMNKP